MSATIISFATYQVILRIQEMITDQNERNEANHRLCQYRREELYKQLRRFGLSIETAEQISEAVWEVSTAWTYKSFHRSSQLKFVGFK